MAFTNEERILQLEENWLTQARYATQLIKVIEKLQEQIAELQTEVEQLKKLSRSQG